tara:strand:- start:554 stop:1627 length:1074 start_codon:yes stop_codon:yes gene_type:complete
MKKIIAILSVVLFSFGVAKAGELSVTGSAKASYAITSSDGTAASNDSAKGLGIENEFTLGASGELDNGYTWSYAVDIDAVESSATNDDAKLTLTTPMGTIGMFLGEGGLGVDNAGSQSVVARPSDTSYNEAMTDTYDIDGYDNIQYHTPADMLPFGITAKIGYAPSGLASAANDFTATGTINNRLATTDTASAGGIVLHPGGSSVSHYQVKAAPIDGLSIGADYVEFSGVLGSTEQAPESGSYFATYAFGPAVIGFSETFLAAPMNAITAQVETVENSKFSIGINVNDNLSVSYEEEESQPKLNTEATVYTMTSTGIQAAYTMGGMTLGVAMNDHENAGYTDNKDVKDTVFTVEMAF